MSSRILFIEDETRVAQAIERGLAASGFDVVVANTGEEGCRQGLTRITRVGTHSGRLGTRSRTGW
jgi:DNA-binding response OmpR family regulator